MTKFSSRHFWPQIDTDFSQIVSFARRSRYVEPTVLSTEDEGFGPVLDWMTSNLTEHFTLDQVADQFAHSDVGLFITDVIKP